MDKRTGAPGDDETFEQVAANGLLHRRALLGKGAAAAGILGAGLGPSATGAAAEPLIEPPWGLQVGERYTRLSDTLKVRQKRGANFGQSEIRATLLHIPHTASSFGGDPYPQRPTFHHQSYRHP